MAEDLLLKPSVSVSPEPSETEVLGHSMILGMLGHSYVSRAPGEEDSDSFVESFDGVERFVIL